MSEKKITDDRNTLRSLISKKLCEKKIQQAQADE